MLKSEKAQQIAVYLLSEPSAGPITRVMGSLQIAYSRGSLLEWSRLDTDRYRDVALRLFELEAIERVGPEWVRLTTVGRIAASAVIIWSRHELLDPSQCQELSFATTPRAWRY